MNQFIVDSLICCAKTIKTPPRKTMIVDQRNEFTLRNDFTCVSEDGKIFEVFIRVNTKLSYLFSIGLRYRSDYGIVTLCRYNGKHPHRNKTANRDSLNDYHIHKLFDEQLASGTDSSIDAEATQRYVTYEEALYSFLNDCHICAWKNFFPDLEEKVSQYRIEGV